MIFTRRVTTYDVRDVQLSPRATTPFHSPVLSAQRYVDRGVAEQVFNGQRCMIRVTKQALAFPVGGLEQLPELVLVEYSRAHPRTPLP